MFGCSLKRRERGRSVKGEHNLGLKKFVQSKLPRVWFELVSLGPFVVLPTKPLLLVLDIFSLKVYLDFTQRLKIISLQLNCAGNFMMNEKLNESAFLIIGLIRQIGR